MSERFTCKDCGRSFIMSYGEQRSYREKGLQIPKHCPECRSRRRAANQSGYKGFSGPPLRPTTQQKPATQHRPAIQQKTAPLPARPEPKTTSHPIAARPKPKTSSRTGSRPRRRSMEWWETAAARFTLLAVGFVAAVAVTTLLIGLPWWAVLLFVVLAINAITLILYRYDKAVAPGTATRVPETVLLGLALLGGSPAAYVAMYRFRRRHKAQKLSFVAVYWGIVVLQVIALAGLLIWLLQREA